MAEGYKRGLYKQVSKRSVFTQEKMSVLLQDKLREFADRQVSLYFREHIKEKTKGRNHDLTVAEYKVAKETERYSQIKEKVDDKEQELVVLEEREKEVVERTEQAELLYQLIKDEGENTLRSRFIDAMVENQGLKEENAKLRDSLHKAYDFMEGTIIDGKNMLERFFEWLSEKVVRTVDKIRDAHKR